MEVIDQLRGDSPSADEVQKIFHAERSHIIFLLLVVIIVAVVVGFLPYTTMKRRLLLCGLYGVAARPSPCPIVGRSLRGGSDEELDAYIEELLASVESEAPPAAVETKDAAQEEENVDAAEEVEEAETVEDDTEEEDSDEEVEEADDESIPDGADLSEASISPHEAMEEEEDEENEEGAADESATDETADETQPDIDKDDEEEDSPSEEATAVSRPSSSTEDPDRSRQMGPPVRPNAIYRILLGQGRLGHVVVMSCVLLIEWIHAYLPPLGGFLAWIATFLFPPTRGPPRGPPRPTPANHRSGQSTKQRRKLTRQADEQALSQLQKLTRDARYRHVSQSFLQRHQLGPYAKTIVVDEAKTSKPLIQPTVSIGVDSKGTSVSVGFEIGMGSKKQTSPSKKKKRRSGPRASDRDGGDGIVGRIRVATGANSRVSRSLFGAYPGDAAPLEQAASASGVTQLAEKYGYGDWSESDGDESPRRRRRRKSSSSVFEADNSSDFGGLGLFDEPSHHNTRRRRRVSRPVDPPLSGSDTLRSRSRPLTSMSSVQRVKPALAGINELKKRRREEKD